MPGLRSFLIASILITVVVAARVVLAQPATMPITGAGVMPATLSAPGLPAVQALAGLMLSPPAQTVQVQTHVALDVVADCGTHADAVAAEVTFDPAYLQVVAVTADESRFPEVLHSGFDNFAGTVYYDAVSLLCHGENACPSGVVRLATVTFRAVARTLPASRVSIRGQVVWSGELIFDGEGSGSTITITSIAADTATPTRTATATDTATPTRTVTTTPQGGATPTATTTPQGNATPTITPPELIYLPIVRRGHGF